MERAKKKEAPVSHLHQGRKTPPSNACHYLPVSDEIMDWGLYVTGVGRATVGKNTAYPPAGHPQLYDYSWKRGRVLPEFQIILVSEGEGVFESEAAGVVEFKSPAAIFLLPGIWHRYKPMQTSGWVENWISFSGETPYRLWADRFIRENEAVIHCDDIDLLMTLFGNLLSGVAKSPARNSISIASHALALIAETIENTSVGLVDRIELPEGDTLAETARTLIWSHSHQTLSIERLAAMTHASRRTLERHFRDRFGHTLHDEIVQCRLSRAKRLLQKTPLPIKAVAYLSGFASTSRMRSDFSSLEGESPSEYRARNKE